MHDALPLLRQAEEVVILIIDAGKLGPRFGPQPGAGILAHLQRHGVAVRVKAVESGAAAIVGLILVQAAEEKADLLVMGLPYKKRFGGDFAIGRTVPYVLKNAPCAVWVVREPIPEDEA